MADRNPYLTDPTALPQRPYRLTIIDEHNQTHALAVDPARIPYSGIGRPGSVLDIALGHGIELDHACGGVCACATCHIIVRAGLESCSPPSEDEEDQLDQAYGLTPQSRLGCQCVPNGACDVVVEIPSWNRNLAREPH